MSTVPNARTSRAPRLDRRAGCRYADVQQVITRCQLNLDPSPRKLSKVYGIGRARALGRKGKSYQMLTSSPALVPAPPPAAQLMDTHESICDALDPARWTHDAAMTPIINPPSAVVQMLHFAAKLPLAPAHHAPHRMRGARRPCVKAQLGRLQRRLLARSVRIPALMGARVWR